jgi:hypothetical protein
MSNEEQRIWVSIGFRVLKNWSRLKLKLVELVGHQGGSRCEINQRLGARSFKVGWTIQGLRGQLSYVVELSTS